MVFKSAVTLFFREEIAAIGHNESHVASAGLIDAGKVDFIEDAMTDGEPDLAVLVERRTGATFGARCPARWNARPPRSIACGGISHAKLCPRAGECFPVKFDKRLTGRDFVCAAGVIKLIGGSFRSKLQLITD